MKIAVVNNFFPPRVGGSSHLSDSLAREYLAAGHDVIVLTAKYGDLPADEICDGLRIVRLPAWAMPQLGSSVDFDLRFAMGPRNLRRVFRILDDFGPDVIHQHGQFFDITWLTSLYARRRKIPTLLSVHTRLESTRRSYDIVFKMLDRILVRPFISASRPEVVIMDELMQRYVERRYSIGPDRQVPIPVGVYVDRFATDGDPERVRTSLGIAEDQPVIVSLGHVIPLRDRMTLVEALPNLRSTHPNLRLVVVGRVYYERFMERARELEVDDMITLTGAVPRNEVVDYLQAADVETHDLQGLGFGTANLEAMMARVPVVAAVADTNFPNVPLVSGKNVTLVPTGDVAALAQAIRELVDDPERARQIVDAQFELVSKHFDMAVVTRQHLDAMHQMVGP